MVRKSVLVPLLAAAVLVVTAGYSFVVVPHAFVRPCGPCPDVVGSSPAPSPGLAAASAGEEDGVVACLRFSRSVLRAVSFILRLLVGAACVHCYNRFADGDEEEDEAPGAAKKAGYVAIADDPEAGTGAGSKN